ncbi:lysine-specific demethylase 5A-like isoform X1 [Asterias rubens]|uniref:lysine-specific demethylase 5A-like isoform X1 n=1 Tax=Asterias rubens TaxID=7604 RepID=UPI001455CDCF|nr:lysine-specific demethylase 5A-like isoform X1 [Asterias rubens]
MIVPEPFIPPPEAPVFEPTEEEFADPLGYIAKIRPIAEKSGICKIRPPSDWQPPFAVDVDNFKFTPRIQRLNELEAKTRIKLNFLDQIAKYWELQGCRLRIPSCYGKSLDLYSLFKVVNDEGGFELCVRERRWSKVATKMGFASKAVGSQLMKHYERILWPYDIFQAGATLDTPVALPEGDCKDKDYVPHGIVSRQAIKPIAGGGYSRRVKRQAPEVSNDPLNIDFSNNPELKKLQLYGPGPKFQGLGLVAGSDKKQDCILKEEDVKAKPLKEESKEEESKIKRSSPRKLDDKSAGSSMTMRDRSNVLSASFIENYVCRGCGRGDAEECLLLCDGCDDSFHTFCLIPPLFEVPKGDWRCPRCLVQECKKPTEAFGFESALKQYTLQSFGEMADQFKRDYFSMPVHMVPPETIEKEFWRLVMAIDEDVKVAYGADIHSLDHGSAFPNKRSKTIGEEDMEYVNSGWNLNNLPVLDGSVLSHINADISGMKVPWMYVGMCFSSFCWHNEDHWSYSINYLHWGEPKTWYGVPGKSADQFEQVMKEQAPELFDAQPDLLQQLVTILSPTILMKNDVPLVRTNQCAGEFVVTFPRAYHAGFNQGYNFAEAVNFCPTDWLPSGRSCIEHYRRLQRFCVFSHEELVCKMAADPDSLDLNLAAAVHKEMLVMVEKEKKLRKQLLERGTAEAEREAFELLPDDERQCDSCKTTCFLSGVTCPCAPNKLVCIHHTDKLCTCHPSKHCLRYRYTLDELPAMLHRLKVRAESFDNWANKVKNALNATQDSKLDVTQLKEMIVEADEKRFPDNELLQQLVSAVTEAERCANVATQLVSKKHRTRQRQQGDSKYANRLTLEELKDFMVQVQGLPCEIREVELVQDLLVKVEGFQAEAQDALCDAIPDSDKLKRLLEAGKGIDIELPEIPKLKQELSQAHWLDEVRATLQIPTNVTLDTLRKLIDSGVSLVPHPAVEKAMAELQELLTVSERWEEKAKICLQAKPRHAMATLDTIVNEARNIPAFLPNTAALNEALKRAKDWTRKMEEIQNGEHFPYLDVLESMVMSGRPVPVRLEQLPQVESQVSAARAWRERTARTFLKKNSPYSLVEVLSSRRDIGIYQSSKARRKKQKDLERLREIEKEYAVDVDPNETRDPAVFVAAYKDNEAREIDLMRLLRDKNRRKQQMEEEGAEQGKYCVCRKGVGGFMLQCELCKDWFHSTCVPLPKPSASKSKFLAAVGGSASSATVQQQQQPQVRDMKFLCPMCLRSRRPRLETILSLLVSLQKLPVRLPEGEALQCLTERGMSWQDRARQALATEELASALAKLSVLSQRIVEQAAKEKEEQNTTAELKKPTPNLDQQEHMHGILQGTLDSNVSPVTDQRDVHSSSILHGMPPVATQNLHPAVENDTFNPADNTTPYAMDTEGHEGLNTVSPQVVGLEETILDSSIEQEDTYPPPDISDSDIPSSDPVGDSEHAYSAPSNSEHAYSAVQKSDQQPPPPAPAPQRKHARKSPHVPRPLESPVLELSAMVKAQLEDLMMEGDLLEVSLDETQHIWRILQACQPVREERFMEHFVQQLKEETITEKILARPKPLDKEKKKLKRKRENEGVEEGAFRPSMLDEAHRLEKRMKKKKNKEKDRIVKKEVVDKIKKEGKENKMKEEHIKKPKKKKVKEEDKLNKPESGEMFVNVDGDEDDEQCSAKHCLQPTGDDISWVQCDKCQKWYHLLCIGMTQEPGDDEEFICRPCIKRQRQSAAAKARHAAQRAEVRRSSGAATPTPPSTPHDIQIKTEPNDMIFEQSPLPLEDEVPDMNLQSMDNLNPVENESQKVNFDESCHPNEPTPSTKEQPEITTMETDLSMDLTREATPTSTIAASDGGVPAAEQAVESEVVREAVAPMDTSEEIISVVSTPVANSPEPAQEEAMDIQEPEVKSPVDRTLEAKTSELTPLEHNSEPTPLEHNSETLVEKSPTPPRALSPELETLQEKPITTSLEPMESQLEPTPLLPSPPVEPSTSLAEPSVTHAEPTLPVPSDTSAPTGTLEERSLTLQEPSVTHEEPCVTHEEPCVTHEEPCVTREEPGVTQEVPNCTQALSDSSEDTPAVEDTTTKETVEGDASELAVS